MSDFPKKQKVRQIPNKDELYALGRSAQQLVPKTPRGKVIDAGLAVAEQTNKRLVPVVVKKDSPAGPDVSTLKPLRMVRRKKRART